MKSHVVDSGLKVAIENHAGDIAGSRLKRLDRRKPGRISWELYRFRRQSVVGDQRTRNDDASKPCIPTCSRATFRDTAVWRVPEGRPWRGCAWARQRRMRIYVRKYCEVVSRPRVSARDYRDWATACTRS